MYMSLKKSFIIDDRLISNNNALFKDKVVVSDNLHVKR